MIDVYDNYRINKKKVGYDYIRQMIVMKLENPFLTIRECIERIANATKTSPVTVRKNIESVLKGSVLRFYSINDALKLIVEEENGIWVEEEV